MSISESKCDKDMGYWKTDGRISYLKRSRTEDWYFTRKDGELTARVQSWRELQRDAIRRAVRFMLDANNVQLMAWRTIRIVIKGQNVRFP